MYNVLAPLHARCCVSVGPLVHYVSCGVAYLVEMSLGLNIGFYESIQLNYVLHYQYVAHVFVVFFEDFMV